MAKEKVNYQEVYDLYQLCSETKDLREFCADYGVNYDKFMNWQRHQLWSEKLGKTVQVCLLYTSLCRLCLLSSRQYRRKCDRFSLMPLLLTGR